MPFQVRNFEIVRCLSKQVISNKKGWISQTFPDIYVFKKDNPHVGVKFRDIQHKKYGFKISSVEIKIDMSQLTGQDKEYPKVDNHFNFYQDWKKYQISFKYKLISPEIYKNPQKLKLLQAHQSEKYQQGNQNALNPAQLAEKLQSFESQLEHLNKKLVQEIKKYLSKKKTLQNVFSQYNILTRWLHPHEQIVQLFMIRKNKSKSWKWQTCTLSVQKFTGESPMVNSNQQNQSKDEQRDILFFQTVSAQSNDKNELEKEISKEWISNKGDKFEQYSQIEKILFQGSNVGLIKSIDKSFRFKYNMSYPQLLENIYNAYLSNKSK